MIGKTPYQYENLNKKYIMSEKEIKEQYDKNMTLSLKITLHAPHSPLLQPHFVPVKYSLSRSISNNVDSGSTSIVCFLLFTKNLIFITKLSDYVGTKNFKNILTADYARLHRFLFYILIIYSD